VEQAVTHALVFVLPMIFVGVVVVLDITVRRDLSAKSQIAWLAAVTLVWPTMILYLLLRPVQGRLVRRSTVRREQPDPRQRLVEGAVDHSAARLTAQEFASLAERLRRQRS
jgi:hypothetical protein